MRMVMKKEKTVEDALKEFLICKKTMGLADESIKDYTNAFGYFMDFYGRDSSTKRD